MDKKELKKLKKEELLKLARKKHLKKISGLKKEELIKELLKFFKQVETKKKKSKVKRTVAKPEKKLKAKIKTAQRVKKTVVRKRETVAKIPVAFEQEYAEATKFDLGSQKVQKPDIFMQEEMEIPSRYQENRFVLLIRDPWWLYGYWEITLDSV